VPYFAWNWLVFDTLAPSSGRALAYMHSYRESFTFTSGLQLIAYQPALDLTWAPQAVLIGGLLLLALAFFTVPTDRRGMLAPLVLYALILAVYYGYVQQQGRPRYYVAVAVVVVVLLCAWGEARTTQRSRWTIYAVAGGVALAVALNTALFVGYVNTERTAAYQAQPAMFAAARWINANLPHEAVVAAQNSGIFQYYSGRVVLNIDGKLNHEIVPVLVQRQLDRYLHDAGVRYLVDLQGVGRYIEFYSSSMSVADPHPEISTLKRLGIHVQRVAARLGLAAPVELAERVPEQVTQPFETLASVEQVFPLPNDPRNAVVIYRLHDQFGQHQ
ncbi:MAG: hypothetical protein HC876_09845, partial [Chloroflexaceae bacterium]|nr:hypothetical protein [Chloroflexaceae bacterium]